MTVAFDVLVPAAVDIDPGMLNLRSQADRNALTGYIELSVGYDVSAINVAPVGLRVEGATVAAQRTPTAVGDYDGDKVPDRMVKFDREAVVNALAGKTGTVTVTVSGALNDGRRFTGSATIEVINPGP